MTYSDRNLIAATLAAAIINSSSDFATEEEAVKIWQNVRSLLKESEAARLRGGRVANR